MNWIDWVLLIGIVVWGIMSLIVVVLMPVALFGIYWEDPCNLPFFERQVRKLMVFMAPFVGKFLRFLYIIIWYFLAACGIVKAEDKDKVFAEIEEIRKRKLQQWVKGLDRQIWIQDRLERHLKKSTHIYNVKTRGAFYFLEDIREEWGKWGYYAFIIYSIIGFVGPIIFIILWWFGVIE